MTYQPNAFISINDPRLSGVDRVDLRAKYGAPLDGASHPLPAAVAVALYPNITVTGSTIERDTAAWLQAEYDLRTGSGGIIGLPDGAGMMVSQQLYLQDASRVWFHGGRNVQLRTEGTGTTPAIQIAKAGSPVLRNLALYAFNNGEAFFGSPGGTAYPGIANSAALAAATGYRTGAVALQIHDSVGATLENVTWVNYDRPLKWGDNTWNITFIGCYGSNNNVGINWDQTQGYNSMERMRFENGGANNNNIGVDWIATFPNSGAMSSQGGSVFFHNQCFDYNVVRHINYVGKATTHTFCNHSFHVSHCHIEANDAVIGAGNPWINATGVLYLTDNEIYVNGGTPSGIVSISDNCFVAMNNNRINGSQPLVYSKTSGPKYVQGAGNIYQAVNTPVVLLSDQNGIVTQMDPQLPLRSLTAFGDGFGLPISAQGIGLIELNYTGNFTVPTDATNGGRHSAGTRFKLYNAASGTITFVAAPGVTLNVTPGHNTLSAQGEEAYLTTIAANTWNLSGPGIFGL